MIACFHTLGSYKCLAGSCQEHWEQRSVSSALVLELEDKSGVAYGQEGGRLIMAKANRHLQPFAKGPSSFWAIFCL